MDQRITIRRGETEAHMRLKRLAFVWAQRQGYSACAMEVALPRCRYRVDVAAYRPDGDFRVQTGAGRSPARQWLHVDDDAPP